MVRLTIVKTIEPEYTWPSERLKRCCTGKCECRDASQCQFDRCKNCDNNIDATGKWIDDWQYHKASLGRCPDCDGPIES